MRTYSIAFISILILIVLPLGANAQALLGQEAPDWTLTDQNGVSHTLSDYACKSAFVLFSSYS